MTYMYYLLSYFTCSLQNLLFKTFFYSNQMLTGLLKSSSAPDSGSQVCRTNELNLIDHLHVQQIHAMKRKIALLKKIKVNLLILMRIMTNTSLLDHMAEASYNFIVNEQDHTKVKVINVCHEQRSQALSVRNILREIHVWQKSEDNKETKWNTSCIQ